METLNDNLLFRWFHDLNLLDPVWEATTFNQNQQHLLQHQTAELFFAQIVALAHAQDWVSDAHFTVDGALVDAWASLLRKGPGKEAKLCFGLHALMENRHGLCVQAQVTTAAGVTATTAATGLLARQINHADRPPPTVGADKGYQ